MSFAKETENIVNQLIQAEYENACEKFGDKYHSLHEGYAILLEEVEEAEKETKFLEKWLDNFWNSIRNNNSFDKKECIEEMIECVENAIKELAQCGAVIMKIKNTLEGNA